VKDPKPQLARPWPLAAIEGGLASAGALISIRGTHDSREPIINARQFGGNVLPLIFDDVPFPTWTDPEGFTWTGPSREQISEALDFSRRFVDQTIAVHCKYGKSRSSALVLMINADRLGVGHEVDAVTALLQYDIGFAERMMKAALFGRRLGDTIVPNPLIVRMADSLLERKGKLIGALADACPAFVRWCAYWEGRRPA
jgi:predicted protein tyrosine phosphatase